MTELTLTKKDRATVERISEIACKLNRDNRNKAEGVMIALYNVQDLRRKK